MYSEAILHLPFAFKAHNALIDISRNVWMNVKIELLYAYLVDELVNFSLKLIRE